MPTQLYRRVKRERLVTYALWLAMVGLLAWGVIAWVNYLSERAEVAERRAAQAERQADHMAELLAESERTQDHLAELVASLEAQEERTRAQRQRFRQDVNAILERLGIEVREHADPSSGPPGGRERTSSVTLLGEGGRVVRRTLRIPSSDLDLSPNPPREAGSGETRSGQRAPPTRDLPASKPRPKPPEPQPAAKPTRPGQEQPEPRERSPQATEPPERSLPDHVQGDGRGKPEAPEPGQGGVRGRSDERGPPDHAQGRDEPPGKSQSSAAGQSDVEGPPSHAAAKGCGKKQGTVN